MAEKVTMKLKVDLECEKCYKKVKKLLCNYPQIRDVKFDEKQNIVTITVVCCSPEKIRDKLCRKGGGSITSIEIVELPKPKPPEPKKKPEPGKTKPPDPKPQLEPPKNKEGKPNGKHQDPKLTPSTQGQIIPPLPRMEVPVGRCCGPCSEGRPGGPCVNDYGVLLLRFDGSCARPVYDSYGGGRPCYVSRCDQYFSEENASGCTIM